MYISVDLAHYDRFQAKIGNGGLISEKVWLDAIATCAFFLYQTMTVTDWLLSSDRRTQMPPSKICYVRLREIFLISF